MYFKITLLALLCNFQVLFAQQKLTFLSQEGDILHIPTEVRITFPDSSGLQSYGGLKTNAKELVLAVNSSYRYITLEVGAFRCSKAYYNEYTPKQFKQLSKVILYQSYFISELKPRVFLNELKTWEKDTLEIEWLAGYLDEYKHHSKNDTIHVALFSAKRDHLFRRLATKHKLKKALHMAGVEYAAIVIHYQDKPYVTAKADFFPTGSVITHAFVRHQNSPKMRKEARKLLTVAFVE